jgi:hypothetical protein
MIARAKKGMTKQKIEMKSVAIVSLVALSRSIFVASQTLKNEPGQKIKNKINKLLRKTKFTGY